MTVVLVRGNPETDKIWGALVAAPGRDEVVRLSLPAFGARLPTALRRRLATTATGLRASWSASNEPVDLVGNDWDGLRVVNVAMHPPELLRSWVSDDVGIFDADYVWHDVAQLWQTAGAGEELIDTMMGGTVDDRSGLLAELGIPLDISTSIAKAQGPEMGRAILAVYRAAAQPVMAEAVRDLENAAARPGLSILATEDAYVGTDESQRRAAQRAGARIEVLDGLGHRWMVQDPARGAEVLNRFWEALD